MHNIGLTPVKSIEKAFHSLDKFAGCKGDKPALYKMFSAAEQSACDIRKRRRFHWKKLWETGAGEPLEGFCSLAGALLTITIYSMTLPVTPLAVPVRERNAVRNDERRPTCPPHHVRKIFFYLCL
jgi:hypothetical protein